MSDLVVDHRLPVRLLGVEYLLEFKEEVEGRSDRPSKILWVPACNSQCDNSEIKISARWQHRSGVLGHSW